MGPSAGVLRSAIVMAVFLGALDTALPAAAQQYEASLQALDYAPDPFGRSPRLLGMGRLTLADDLHNRITLWDFAGNPAGIAEAESVTTLEYRPVIRSSSALRDLAGPPAGRERQELAARQVRHGIEAWHRARGAAAYGLTAEVATLQFDRSYAASIEQRGKFIVPAIGGAVNGRVPWLKTDRFDYALRLEHSREVLDDSYLPFLELPQGQYIGKRGVFLPSPDVFTPNRLETSSLRGGAALSMRVARGIKAAIGYDRARVKVDAKNEGLRSTSRTQEKRPFNVGQASLIGRIGGHLEWGADGRAWSSSSEETYFWSVSAGPTQEPMTGIGKRLDRKEEGSALRTRLRWTIPSFELGAGFGTTYRRTIVTPWYPTRSGDQPGFNDFLDQVGNRVGADTLLLPERVQFSRIEDRRYEMSAGGSWFLPRGRGVLGAEAHRWRLRSDLNSAGAGVKPTGWDVRAGGEYHCGPALIGRAGWSYGLSDRDGFTADNTYRRTFATTGFGYRPQGSSWSVDFGYAYEWLNPDFQDPARSRRTDQQLSLQMRWQL